MNQKSISVIIIGSIIVFSSLGSNCGGNKMESTLPDFNKLWNYGDPAATRIKFEEILPQAEKSGDKSYLLQLLTQIARTYGLESDFENANKLLDRVESQMTDDLPIVKIRYLLERGRTFRSSGSPEKSIPLFNESFEVAKKNGEDFYAVDAAHMMALVAENAEKRMEWSNIALKFAEESKDERARNWKGSLYNNIGWEYHSAQQYDKALLMFEKALTFRKEQGKQEGIDIAEWCVARCLRSLGRNDEAMDMQLELLRRHQNNGGKDGYVFEELGELYLLKGDNANARRFFASAYAELSQDKWLMDNETERINRIRKLGGVE